MQIKRLILPTLLALALGACAGGQQQVETKLPERGDDDYYKVRDSIADEVYVNPEAAAGLDFNNVRRIYIAPANTAHTQIIQPPGVRSSDADAWVMTPAEDDLIQNTLVREFTAALEMEDAFDVVDSRSEAELALYSTVIAIHPNKPKSAAESGARVGGSITMSFALVNAETNEVAIRTLDSKSTDDIWAFDRLQGDMSAVELILRAWGGQIRRSVMFLQGRYNDPLMGPVQLKPQK